MSPRHFAMNTRHAAFQISYILCKCNLFAPHKITLRGSYMYTFRRHQDLRFSALMRPCDCAWLISVPRNLTTVFYNTQPHSPIFRHTGTIIVLPIRLSLFLHRPQPLLPFSSPQMSGENGAPRFVCLSVCVCRRKCASPPPPLNLPKADALVMSV